MEFQAQKKVQVDKNSKQFISNRYFCITLVYNYEDLLISVGGYLGLFIGVSLMDVAGFIVECIDSVISKTVKNAK